MAQSGVSFTTSQAGPQRTSKILKTLAKSMHVERLAASIGRDELSRYELVARASVSDSRGQMAVKGSTEWFSDGLQYHAYFRVAAFRCESNGQCTDATRRSEGPDAGISVQLPENSNGVAILPTAVYRGDFNSDGRADIMIVLENGSSMVFTQNK